MTSLAIPPHVVVKRSHRRKETARGPGRRSQRRPGPTRDVRLRANEKIVLRAAAVLGRLSMPRFTLQRAQIPSSTAAGLRRTDLARAAECPALHTARASSDRWGRVRPRSRPERLRDARPAGADNGRLDQLPPGAASPHFLDFIRAMSSTWYRTRSRPIFFSHYLPRPAGATRRYRYRSSVRTDHGPGNLTGTRQEHPSNRELPASCGGFAVYVDDAHYTSNAFQASDAANCRVSRN